MCITQLDITYHFIQCCIDSEHFRQSSSLEIEDKTDGKSIKSNASGVTQEQESFTCNSCGKSFQQQKYLSQHISKLHSNKKLDGEGNNSEESCYNTSCDTLQR